MEIDLEHLWTCCAFGLQPVWPKHAAGMQTGDIWRYSKLSVPGKPGSDLVSFHKLTQWLMYSLIEVIEMPDLLGLQIAQPEIKDPETGKYLNAMT